MKSLLTCCISLLHKFLFKSLDLSSEFFLTHFSLLAFNNLLQFVVVVLDAVSLHLLIILVFPLLESLVLLFESEDHLGEAMLQDCKLSVLRDHFFQGHFQTSNKRRDTLTTT
jgi:hypothetical protein